MSSCDCAFFVLFFPGMHFCCHERHQGHIPSLCIILASIHNNRTYDKKGIGRQLQTHSYYALAAKYILFFFFLWHYRCLKIHVHRFIGTAESGPLGDCTFLSLFCRITAVWRFMSIASVQLLSRAPWVVALFYGGAFIRDSLVGDIDQDNDENHKLRATV